MNQAHLAKELGISRGRVSQLKQAGMPIDSVEAARAWRAKSDQRGTSRRGSGSRPSISAAVAHLEKHKPIPSGDRPSDDSPQSAIWRARESERIAYDHYAVAVEAAKASARHAAKEDASADSRARADADLAPLQSLLRAHGMALTNRLSAEASFERHLRRSGELAPVEQLENILDATLEPLMAQLCNLPAMVAAAANPSAPAIAEAAIAVAVKEILQQIAAAIEKPSTSGSAPPRTDGNQ